MLFNKFVKMIIRFFTPLRFVTYDNILYLKIKRHT